MLGDLGVKITCLAFWLGKYESTVSMLQSYKYTCT